MIPNLLGDLSSTWIEHGCSINDEYINKPGDKDMINFAEELETAFNNQTPISLSEPFYVWRGIAEEQYKTFTENKIEKNLAFMSTSTSFDIARDFVNRGGAILCIYIHKNTPFKAFKVADETCHANEQEILFPAGTEFSYLDPREEIVNNLNAQRKENNQRMFVEKKGDGYIFGSIPVIFMELVPVQGGSAKNKLSFQNKHYVVRICKQTKKPFIMINKTKTLLSSIRHRYRWVAFG